MATVNTYRKFREVWTCGFSFLRYMSGQSYRETHCNRARQIYKNISIMLFLFPVTINLLLSRFYLLFSVCSRVHRRPCTPLCTWPCTSRVHGRIHGRVHDTAVFTARTRPRTWPYRRPVPHTAGVRDRVHGPYTVWAVYTVMHTCTRPVDGHRHASCKQPYTTVYVPWTWPSTRLVHGRVHVYTARVRNV